ncbi:MAG: hypothetical protein IT481_06255 [Gammaproteobacteria bacterium]|nr:hypothetical protein [Gammaproteobacteria bacterium]
MQNSALGIALAMPMLGLPEPATPSVVYALAMNAIALAVIALRRHGSKSRLAAAGRS